MAVQIAKRNELRAELMPKCWIVECGFAWLKKNRHLSKNCRKLLSTSLQFVHLAFFGVLLNEFEQVLGRMLLKKENYFTRDEVKAFVFSAVIFFILHQIYRVKTHAFLGDAELYWALAEYKYIVDFPNEVRGYFYPFLLSPVRWISDIFDSKNFVYRFFSATVFGFLLGVFLPNLYVRIFGGKLTVLRRLLVPLLVAVIFPGVILYPLSDLPAFVLLLGAIWGLEKAKSEQGQGGSGYFYLLMAGFFLGGAYNSRTIYLFPLAFILLVFFIFLFSKKNSKGGIRRLMAGIMVFLGLLIASLPQMLINKKHHDSYTPTVVAGGHLFAYQLKWGAAVQKYSTTIDKEVGGGQAAGLFYLDRAGMKMLAGSRAEKARGGFSIGEYAGLVAKNPLDFFAIYARHVIAGLDVRDGELYIKNHTKRRNMISIFNFLVLFLGVWVFVAKINENSPLVGAKMERVIWSVAMLLPVLTIIPGAIETRFFLPFHLLVYCSVAFQLDWKWIRGELSTSPWRIASWFLFAALFYFSTALTIEASLEYYFDRGV